MTVKTPQFCDRVWKVAAIADGKAPGSIVDWMLTAVDWMLTAPLRWKCEPGTRMAIDCDIFQESIPDGLLDRMLAVAALCPHLTLVIVTQRSKRMREYFAAKGVITRILLAAQATQRPDRFIGGGDMGWPIRNLHLYVSVEDQATAEERIPDLLATPAAVRGLSLEPLLGAVDVGQWLPPEGIRDDLRRRMEKGGSKYSESRIVQAKQNGWLWIDHVILGGESGPGARPMHANWARKVRDDCVAAGVPFFFKQWGAYEYMIDAHDAADHLRCSEDWRSEVRDYAKTCAIVCPDGQRIKIHDGADDKWDWWQETEFPEGAALMHRVGKKRAGRLLDGVEHNELPETPHA